MPFTKHFPPGVADTTLIDRLTAPRELQGLLRMAVAGLSRVVQQQRFAIPESVRKATAKFRMEADPIQAFIDDRLKVTWGREFIPRTEVYEEYRMWAAMSGFSPMANQRFYEQFISALVQKTKQPLRDERVRGIQGYRNFVIKR